MAGMPRPWIIFAGAWNDRVDRSARRRAWPLACPTPPWCWSAPCDAARPRCPQRARPRSGAATTQLPAHLQAADIGIIPYRREPFNDASCPLKLYEYLAAGLPVVASAVDVGWSRTATWCAAIDDVDGFADAVAAAGRPATCGPSVAPLAAAHSWDERASALLDALATASRRADTRRRRPEHTTTGRPSTSTGAAGAGAVEAAWCRALLVAWLGAQAVAGWKFANGTTYPVVGSAMFNGPPTGAGRDFMVPRVFAVTAIGRTARDGPAHVRAGAVRVAAVDQAPPRGRRRRPRPAVRPTSSPIVFHRPRADSAPPVVAIELWRVPALDEHLDHGRTDPDGDAVTASLAEDRRRDGGPGRRVDVEGVDAGSGSPRSRQRESGCCASGCSASCSSTSCCARRCRWRWATRPACSGTRSGRRGCSTRSASGHRTRGRSGPSRSSLLVVALRRDRRLALPAGRPRRRRAVPLLAVPRSVVGRDEARPRQPGARAAVPGDGGGERATLGRLAARRRVRRARRTMRDRPPPDAAEPSTNAAWAVRAIQVGLAILYFLSGLLQAALDRDRLDVGRHAAPGDPGQGVVRGDHRLGFWVLHHALAPRRCSRSSPCCGRSASR